MNSSWLCHVPLKDLNFFSKYVVFCYPHTSLLKFFHNDWVDNFTDLVITFFPVKIFLLFTWFFDIILLSYQFFWKNNFRFRMCFKNFLLDVVWPDLHRISVTPETLKYWVGVQRGHSYLMGRRCFFSLGWPPF